jgi:hypothetical protein
MLNLLDNKVQPIDNIQKCLHRKKAIVINTMRTLLNVINPLEGHFLLHDGNSATCVQ